MKNSPPDTQIRRGARSGTVSFPIPTELSILRPCCTLKSSFRLLAVMGHSESPAHDDVLSVAVALGVCRFSPAEHPQEGSVLPSGNGRSLNASGHSAAVSSTGPCKRVKYIKHRRAAAIAFFMTPEKPSPVIFWRNC
eukprot:1228661-Pleurochrysis_carterae.AAC.2